MLDGDCAYSTDIQTPPCRLYPSREEISIDNPRGVGLSPVNPNTDEFGRAVVIDKVRNRDGLSTLTMSRLIDRYPEAIARLPRRLLRSDIPGWCR